MTIGSASSKKMPTLGFAASRAIEARDAFTTIIARPAFASKSTSRLSPERFLGPRARARRSGRRHARADPKCRNVKTLAGCSTLGDSLRSGRALSPRPGFIYERVIDPNEGLVAAVRARSLAEFTPPFVVSLRDAVAKRHKRWMANYRRQSLCGWPSAGAAFTAGAIPIPRTACPCWPGPADAPERNRPWSAEEFEIVYETVRSPSLAPRARACPLRRHARRRHLAVPWSAWDGEYLSFRQSKTGQLVQFARPAASRTDAGQCPP